jgi:hypothetical protein
LFLNISVFYIILASGLIGIILEREWNFKKCS